MDLILVMKLPNCNPPILPAIMVLQWHKKFIKIDIGRKVNFQDITLIPVPQKYGPV